MKVIAIASTLLTHLPSLSAKNHGDSPLIKPKSLSPRATSFLIRPENQRFPIQYYGGKVMTGPIKLVHIWYGNWTAEQRTHRLLKNFAENVGKSEWWSTQTLYYGENEPVVNGSNCTYIGTNVTLSAEYFDSYSLGIKLIDDDIYTIIQNNVEKGGKSIDEDTQYIVIGSSDLDKSLYCTNYCGYHRFQIISGRKLYMAYIQDSSKCQGTNSTPGKPGIPGCLQPYFRDGRPALNDYVTDALVDIYAHEIAEIATNPELTAWEDQNRSENIDKCAGDYGTILKRESDGANYNMEIGGVKYLVQTNLHPVTQDCVLKV